MLAVLLGCGLRRSELTDLTLDHLQRREEHWAIIDLVGKGGHIRTVPVPDWVKRAIDDWLRASRVTEGRVFRRVCRTGMAWGTDVQVYFCDPRSPWQRGSNENTNRLLRQCFPKNTDLTDYSQSDLNKVAQRLNQRPRQTLGFHTPASKLQESVASTH
jgi:Phage integrase family